jgi:hypothetical protein
MVPRTHLITLSLTGLLVIGKELSEVGGE